MSDEAIRELERQIGKLLETARESRGVSLEEAQQATTIHVHHLEALERGDLEDLEALHGPTWARAFLVRYANWLGLDGEGLAEQVLPLERSAVKKGFFSSRRRALAAVLGVLAVLVTTAFAITILTVSSPTSVGAEDQRVALILDASETAGTDSIMVAKIAQEDPGLLLIPRNTVVEIPDHGIGEIASALALGGPDLVRRSTAQLTAVEIPSYALIDAAAVKEIVDMMDGIQVNVPNPVSGVSTNRSPMTVQPGQQTLNGDQVLVYLQGRDLPSDVERAERQRVLLDEMFRQAFTVENLLSNPVATYEVTKKIETNMSNTETLRLARGVRAMFGESDAPIQVDTIPGYEETLDLPADGSTGSSWVLNAQELPTVLDNTIQ